MQSKPLYTPKATESRTWKYRLRLETILFKTTRITPQGNHERNAWGFENCVWLNRTYLRRKMWFILVPGSKIILLYSRTCQNFFIAYFKAVYNSSTVTTSSRLKFHMQRCKPEALQGEKQTRKKGKKAPNKQKRKKQLVYTAVLNSRTQVKSLLVSEAFLFPVTKSLHRFQFFNLVAVGWPYKKEV